MQEKPQWLKELSRFAFMTAVGSVAYLTKNNKKLPNMKQCWVLWKKGWPLILIIQLENRELRPPKSAALQSRCQRCVLGRRCCLAQQPFTAAAHEGKAAAGTQEPCSAV